MDGSWADGLWAEASLDHEAAAKNAALDRVEAELQVVMPFFLAAKSPQEYQHRRALAAERLTSIALHAGVEAGLVSEMADRQMDLYFDAIRRTALPEGYDPLTNIEQATHFEGTGPEVDYGHSEGPDFSHSYGEVPLGRMEGPPPNVVTPQYEKPGSVDEATAKKARKKAKKQAALQRRAQDFSVLPAGSGAGGVSSPDGSGPGGSMAPPPGAPMSPAGGAVGGPNLSAGDPYNIQVTSVARSVLASNPHLPEAEARRLARRVVGSYLRQADLNSSVVSDDYGSGSGQGSGGSGGGGGMSGLEEYGLGKALINKLPGFGPAAGAGAGVADVAELAAL